VTTYGIPPYNEAEAAADPAAIAARQPVVVSQFRVSPDQQLVGRSGSDRLQGGNGDDTIDGGKGNDLLTGRLGSDLFVFRPDSRKDTVTDFNVGEGDRLVLVGFDFQTSVEALTYARQVGGNVVFDFGRAEITLAGVELANLAAAVSVGPDPLLGY
jgi:Ca2+-binding RTX toxin-like protein